MSQLNNRKICLVGGAGFIGHNLALKLKSLGAEVSIIDSLEVNNLHSFKKNVDVIPNSDLYLKILHKRIELLKEAGIELIEADSRDYIKLSEIIGAIAPDSLVHLAAVAHANVSNKDPHSTFDHSLRTLENTLDISRSNKSPVKHYVYFSSSMVYGNFVSGIVDEETPCEPLGIYGALKYAGEKIVKAYNQVFGMNYTIIRPSALYGERCVSRRVGQIFIENAMHGLKVKVSGDGSDRLDFTYIDDLVHGIVCVLSSEKSYNETFNLTYGESRSIAQMTGILKDRFPDLDVEYTPKDRLTPDRGTLSVEKAKQLIGYNPQFPLEKGFVKYIDWYRHLFDEINADNKVSV